MAGPWYVSDQGDDSDGLSWATSYQSVENLLIQEALGDGEFVYLAHTHQEDASGTITLNLVGGTEDNPLRFISATAGSDSPVVFEAGANVNADSAAFDLFIGSGNSVWYGVTFSAGDDFGYVGPNTTHVFHDCNGISASGSLMRFVQSEITVKWFGGTLVSSDTAGASVSMQSECVFLCRGATITMASANSSEPLVDINGDASRAIFEDCDFSGSTADMVPCVFTGSTRNNIECVFRRCKLPASYTMQSITIDGNNVVKVESCSGGTSTVPFLGVGGDAGNSTWRSIIGDIKTVITQKRVGGTSDGVNDYSWEMEANANVSFYAPLESPPITYWAEPGAQTVTIFTADDADLNDDELWMVVEYPDDSVTNAEPDHVVLSNTKPNPLVAPSAVARDSGSTWDGAGTGTDGSTGQQKLVSSSFNPTVAGPVLIRVYLAKASATMYVDPKPLVA